MKARESGMPEEETWSEFFDVEKILDELEVNNEIEKLADLGSGYGTFAIPAAKRIKGKVLAFDIENEMIGKLNSKLLKENLQNVALINKDFIKDGTGLGNEEIDFVFLFNILHAEESANILKEACRILKKNGRLGVIHWNYDSSTPRGPAMEIRPKPEDLESLLINAEFSILKHNINLQPYHYGILAQK